MITEFKIFEDYENGINKDYYINFIFNMIYYSGEDVYSTADFELGSDPIFKEEDDKIFLIDRFYEDEFGYTVYSGHKKESYIDDGYAEYINLNKDTLKEIYQIFVTAYENKYINFDDIKDKITDENSYNDVKNLSTNINFPIDVLYNNYEEWKKHQKAKEFNI